MIDLWKSDAIDDWTELLRRYPTTIEQQGSRRLPELDEWYREELPRSIGARSRAHVTHEELVRVTEWKMARGMWRARNLVLVRGNDPAEVVEVSATAFEAVPDPGGPIRELSRLAGVGPATASAMAAAAAPAIHPFFDELVSNQVPGLGPVKYSLGYYVKYAAALRERAERLGGSWTPVMVERALWTNAGGKAGVSP